MGSQVPGKDDREQLQKKIEQERQNARRQRLADLIYQCANNRCKAFAAMCGIAASLISAYKTGDRPITEPTCVKIEIALGMPGCFELPGSSPTYEAWSATTKAVSSIRRVKTAALIKASQAEIPTQLVASAMEPVAHPAQPTTDPALLCSIQDLVELMRKNHARTEVQPASPPSPQVHDVTPVVKTATSEERNELGLTEEGIESLAVAIAAKMEIPAIPVRYDQSVNPSRRG